MKAPCLLCMYVEPARYLSFVTGTMFRITQLFLSFLSSFNIGLLSSVGKSLMWRLPVHTSSPLVSPVFDSTCQLGVPFCATSDRIPQRCNAPGFTSAPLCVPLASDQVFSSNVTVQDIVDNNSSLNSSSWKWQELNVCLGSPLISGGCKHGMKPSSSLQTDRSEAHFVWLLRLYCSLTVVHSIVTSSCIGSLSFPV